MRFLFLLLITLNFNALANSNYTTISKPQSLLSLAELKKFCGYRQGDIFVGNPKTAKVIVTGYTAFSCPHCGDFVNTIMPKLKKKYFENKNKSVAYIYRAFPMSLADVKAKQLLKCGNLNNDEKVRFIEMLYSTASSWVHTPNFEKKLTQISRLFGLSDNNIFMCLGVSKDKENEMIAEITDVTTKTGLKGVPMICVNGRIVEGYSYDKVTAMIDEELK